VQAQIAQPKFLIDKTQAQK